MASRNSDIRPKDSYTQADDKVEHRKNRRPDPVAIELRGPSALRLRAPESVEKAFRPHPAGVIILRAILVKNDLEELVFERLDLGRIA